MHTAALLRVGEAQRVPRAADQLAVQHLRVGARQVLQLASLLVPDDSRKVVPRGLRVRIVSVDHALLRGDDLEQLRVPAMRGAELRRGARLSYYGSGRAAHFASAAGSSGSSTTFAAGFGAGGAAGAGVAAGGGSATAAGAASLIMTTRLLCGTKRTPLYALTPA